MKLFSSLLITFFLFPYSAWSLVEIRGGYQALSTSGVTDQDHSITDMRTPGGMTADVLAVFSNFIAGARYESLVEKMTSGNTYFDSKFDRASIVGGYRIMQETLYWGPMVTLGISSQFNYSSSTGSPAVNMKAPNKSTYSVGMEGGYIYENYLVGAEIGYMSARLGNLQNQNTGADHTVNGSTLMADLSGMYFRLLGGFSF